MTLSQEELSEAMVINIEGQEYLVEEVQTYGYLPLLICGEKEFYVAESHESAGKAAREYWKDMARDYPGDFVRIVGKENLVKWALGQWAGPGSVQVRSLEEWLNLHLDVPEEQFGGYDGTELVVQSCSDDLVDELGFKPTVAYRWN